MGYPYFCHLNNHCSFLLLRIIYKTWYLKRAQDFSLPTSQDLPNEESIYFQGVVLRFKDIINFIPKWRLVSTWAGNPFLALLALSSPTN